MGLPDNSSTGHRYGSSAFIERDATLANVRYFVARGPFFKSTSSGANWSATTTTHPFGSPFNAQTTPWVWDLSADPIRSNNLWAAADWAGVKVSRDGGLTWTHAAKYFNAKYVSSCDGKVAIFGKATGDAHPRLYYFTDDGATFTALTSATHNFHWVQGITVDRNGKVWVSWNSVTVVTPKAAVITGVDNVTLENGSTLLIYPNPVNGGNMLHLQLLNVDYKADITLYDIAGKIVLHETIYTNNNQLNYSIGIPNKLKGIYMLVVENASVRKTSRVVIVN